MDYELINKALEDITTLRYGSVFPRISETTIDNLRGQEIQGEYNECIEIYSLGKDDLHLKLTLRSDSYGDNEFVSGVQVVKPIKKTVTDFEAV